MKAPRAVSIAARQHAIDSGERTYFTGYPCAKGHTATRYVYQNKCTLCTADTYRRCAAAKREQYTATAQKWAERNRAKMNEVKAAYRNSDKGQVAEVAARTRNADKRKAAEIARRAADPSVRIVWNHTRKAKMLHAIPVWNGDLDELVFSEAARLARLRGKVTGFSWHVDHVVPLVSPLVSGFHTAYNIAVIPAAENMRKANRYWPGKAA